MKVLPVVSKVRQIKERSVSPSKVVSFSEKDWSELLRLQEGVYGLVSKLKEISPKLTEEDLRVCAFLREGIQPACFADLMKLTVETLTRRISRIKTEKLMLVSSKESLEDYIKIIVVHICPELPDKKLCFSTPYRNGMSVSVRLKMPVLYHCSITLQTKKVTEL